MVSNRQIMSVIRPTGPLKTDIKARYRSFFVCLVMMGVCSVGTSIVYAQQDTMAPRLVDPSGNTAPDTTGGVPSEEDFEKKIEKKSGVPKVPTEEEIKEKIKQDDKSPFDSSKIRSLFFTHWQYEALLDAKNTRGNNTRPPTQSELDALGTEKVKPENRDLTLGGIVYVNAKDWTIWLNGMRVTPNAIPKEVIDLRVSKEYIEVKWLDDYTNQVFPIRIRAHQRFNLDTRIFLPGE